MISKNNQKLPHVNVYTRLQVSPTHKVGVFAIRDILKDINIFKGEEVDMVWIDKIKVKNIDPELQKLYDYFCVLRKGKYLCPKNFNMLSVGWYLNHSSKKANIKKGEELFVDYTTYSE